MPVVTGGTYTAGTATFTNATGGTFDVNGFFTGVTSGSSAIYVSGSTLYSNNPPTSDFSTNNSVFLGAFCL